MKQTRHIFFLMLAVPVLLAATTQHAIGVLPCRNYRAEADCSKEAESNKASNSSIPMGPATGNAVPMGRITVTADPEDQAPPPIGRWERFVRALGPDPRVRRTYTETVFNDGSRMTCYTPCVNDNCCVAAGDSFSLARPMRGGL
jgi:hypothetical protein